MKHASLLLFSLFFSVFLSACGEEGVKDEAPALSEKVTVSLRGIISKRENASLLYEEGMHVLTTDEKEKYILKSPVIDISKYEGQVGTVHGEKEEAKNGQEYPIITVYSIDKEITNEESRQSVFTEQKYSFVGRLPSNWQRNETKEGVLTFFPEGEPPVIFVSLFGKSTPEAVQAKEEMRKGIHITIGGKDAKNVRGNGGNLDIYVDIEGKDEVIKFSFEPGKNPDEEKLVFYEMMSDLEWTLGEDIPAEPQEGRVHCGGVAKKRCPDGYRCEVMTMDQDASGICISSSATPSEVSEILSKEVFFGEEGEKVSFDGFTPDYAKYAEYKNNTHSFLFKIPNNWHWRNKGKTETALSSIELSDTDVTDENAFAAINVISGSLSKPTEKKTDEEYILSVPRDEKTHFEVLGKSEYEIQLKSIALSFTEYDPSVEEGAQ